MRQRSVAVTVGFVGLLAFTAILFGCNQPTGGGDNNTYTVTYDANGADSGSAPSDQTKSEGTDLTLADNSGNLARDGYTFAGWNTAADGSGISYPKGATYTADADLTLYADWEVATYTVTYNANGATSGTTPANQTKTIGTDLTLANNTGVLERSGFSFVGWNTKTDGSGGSYAEGATYSGNADLTLYAEWSYVDYEIGDKGPAGGKIFYDDKDDGNDDIAGARYLEAWEGDEGEYKWKTSATSTSGTSTAVGSGYENTYSAMTGPEHPAAQVVRDATHGGYTDWFLPSKDELNLLYTRDEEKGIFTNFLSKPGYWSSSQDAAKKAWDERFDTGNQRSRDKRERGNVRAIRAF
jgi:uncharacterized repeat protein (TIGR02543 family)